MATEFEKYAIKHLGISSTALGRYTSFTNAYINPSIIEERQMNVAVMDVFSRLMMDRIIFLGVPISDDVANIIQAQLPQYMEEVVGCDRVVVMDGGRIAMTGTPRELFSRADELRACGLDTPDAVQMRDALVQGGVPLAGDPISIEELADSIWQSLSNR